MFFSIFQANMGHADWMILAGVLLFLIAAVLTYKEARVVNGKVLEYTGIAAVLVGVLFWTP